MSPFPTPCKGKSKSQPFPHTFALTGRRRLYADTQGVALGWGLDALSGRARRRFELIEFLQRGCGLRRSSLVGLRRRNNEFNELTNCRAARVRGIAYPKYEPPSGRWRRQVRINRFFATGLRAAPQFVGWPQTAQQRIKRINELPGRSGAGLAPERGSYSRIGARPYLPPQLIDSRYCPCKGRISWAGLAPQ